MDYQGRFTGPEIDERLELAKTAYQKPEDGIPKSDLDYQFREEIKEMQHSISELDSQMGNKAEKAGSLNQDFAARSISVKGRGSGNGIKLYRSDGSTPYGRILMENDLSGSVGIDYVLPTYGIATGSTIVLARAIPFLQFTDSANASNAALYNEIYQRIISGYGIDIWIKDNSTRYRILSITLGSSSIDMEYQTSSYSVPVRLLSNGVCIRQIS